MGRPIRWQASQADDDGGIQHVFHVNVPLRRAEAHRMCICTIAARMQNGDTHKESFDVAVDPSNAMPVSVVSGPTRSSSTYAHLWPSIVLYVERAALDDRGQLLVQGWVVSHTAVVAVQVFIDEENIGAAQLGGERDDVGTAFPAYPNARQSGFTLSKHIDVPTAAVSTLRVQAISLNGFLHEAVLPVERVRALGSGQPVEAASGADPVADVAAARLSSGDKFPVWLRSAVAACHPDLRRRRCGSLLATRAGRSVFTAIGWTSMPTAHLNVVGWAVCAIGISTITVYLDDQEMGEAELGLSRADVGAEYRHIPMARFAGFRFAKTLGDVPSGEHRIRVVLRNGLDDVRDEVRTVRIERAPPPPPPAAPAEFRMEIDRPTVKSGAVVEPITGRLTIEGWALARSGITGIEVLLDDQRLGDAHYGLARQDVGVAFPDWVELAAQRLRVPLPAAQSAQRRTRRAAQRVRAQWGSPEASLRYRGPQVRGIRGWHDHPPPHDAGGSGCVGGCAEQPRASTRIPPDPASRSAARYRRAAGDAGIVADTGVPRLAAGNTGK